MKKDIGLFLSTEPKFGGVYQYSLSIINALDTLDDDKYNIHCFAFDLEWFPFVPDGFEKVVIKKYFFEKILGFVLRKLFFFPAGWRLSGRFSSAVRVIDASDCDVVIYPAQDSVAYQTNTKSMATIHDLMHRYEPHFEEYQGREVANRDMHYSSMCKYADLILVDSIVGRQHVLESYPVRVNKVKILPFVPPYYLLDSRLVDVRKKYDLPERYVFYPAQFWEHKNHINLLVALKLLKDGGQIVNLVLVGSKKNNYSNVKAKIDELGLSNNVFILGYVSNEDIYSLYKSAIAMVFVSLIGPTNIPPMEALITGCPLICSNAYAMPEQVGESSLLVDPKDPVDIASKINLVWNDNESRKNLIELGYKQAKKYGQDDFTKILCGNIDILLFPTA